VGLALGFLAGSLAFRPARATAQDAAAERPVVLRVEIEGNRNVSAEQIERWFAVRAGDRFDSARIARAVEGLMQKERFADVQVEGEAEERGVVLYVRVEEFPQLAEVRLEGAREIKESDLRGDLRLGPGAFLAPWLLRADVARVTQRYKDKGYFRASVSDTLLAAGDGRFNLTLRIQEGLKASVKRIAFTGNNTVPEGRLRKEMETHEDGLLSGGDLKPEVLQKDFDALTKYYGSLGYLDAQVLGHDLQLADNGKDLTVVIQMQEGRQYFVGDVTWEGNTVFDNAAIASRVRLFKGQPFSETAYEQTTTGIYELYQDRGYFYFSATPRRDVRDNVVNLLYQIVEGQQAKLNHVRVVGNSKTQDKVVLREFLLLPGDTFEREKLVRSMREVFQLGFFEDVVPNVTPRGEDGALVDVELRVTERQTGQLGAGAGYSAANGVTGFFEMAETNLFGAGKRLSLRWEFSKYRNDINFSYTHPWFLDTPTTLTVDLFNSGGKASVNSYYRVERLGGALRVGRRLDFLDYTTASWRYRAERVKFTDFDSTVPDSVRADLGTETRRFATGLTLRRNSTDSPFFPTRGTDAEISADLAGTFLGGDESYARLEQEISWFQKVGFSRLAFMLRSRLGFIQGLEGLPVPNDLLYRLGGVFYNGVRGYDDFEIVPLGNPPYQGGQAMGILIGELRYPFSQRVHGAVFFDAGNTWNTFKAADFSNLRKGAGLGVRVEVPMLGLMGLDYAYGFDRLDAQGRSNDSWNFHFRFGSLF
jgi:outer membrane protein insertion porin family